jgi:hypothetical protein
VIKAKRPPARPLKLQIHSIPVTKLDLVRAIETGKMDDLPSHCQDFVSDVRSRLGVNVNEVVTESWTKQQGLQLLRFNYWLQVQFQKFGVQGLRLMPVFGVRRQHIHMDMTALIGMFSSLGLCTTDNSASSFKDSFIVPPGTLKHRARWSGFISTDGVSAAFHFKKPRLGAANKSRALAQLRKDDADDKLAVIGIDPGRHSIVHAAVRLPEDRGILSAHLSRTRYYNSSGISATITKTKFWDADIATKWKLLERAKGTLRTPDSASIVAYLEEYVRWMDEWWANGTMRKRAKQAFRTFGGRKRVTDKFFHKLKTDVKTALPGHKLAVAYGGATFSPSAKGQVAVPTTQAYKACTRHFTTFKQNECRTSRQCCFCHHDVESCWTQMKIGIKIADDTSDEVVTVSSMGRIQCHGQRVPRSDAHDYQRGLLFCPNCSRYLNRDKSAALNIAYLWAVTALNNQPMPDMFRARRKTLVPREPRSGPSSRIQ